MDVSKDVENVRSLLREAPDSGTLTLNCLTQLEAVRIQEFLSPAERERVVFQWLPVEVLLMAKKLHPGAASQVEN